MVKPAAASAIQIATQYRPHLFHIAAPDVNIQDVADPAYWRNAGKEIAERPWCLIECVSSTGEWECTLRVTAATWTPANGASNIVVRMVSSWQDDQVPPAIPAGYNLLHDEYGGTWRVVRTISPRSGVVAERIATEADARRAAIEHQASIDQQIGRFATSDINIPLAANTSCEDQQTAQKADDPPTPISEDPQSMPATGGPRRGRPRATLEEVSQ